MSELRTPEVEDLLAVLSALDDKDTIFQLLEDLFTVREIRETSQRLAVARQLDAGNSYASIEKVTGASAKASKPEQPEKTRGRAPFKEPGHVAFGNR